MRVFIILSIAALVYGHPVQENGVGEPAKTDCGKLAESERQACEERNKVHSIQKRDADPNADPNKNGKEQIAYSEEGNVAKQGNKGQYVYASDKGGPIVQILQRVFKSSCCRPGSNCPCPVNQPMPAAKH